jgi:hypothetical protein
MKKLGNQAVVDGMGVLGPDQQTCDHLSYLISRKGWINKTDAFLFTNHPSCDA